MARNIWKDNLVLILDWLSIISSEPAEGNTEPRPGVVSWFEKHHKKYAGKPNEPDLPKKTLLPLSFRSKGPCDVPSDDACNKKLEALDRWHKALFKYMQGHEEAHSSSIELPEPPSYEGINKARKYLNGLFEWWWGDPTRRDGCEKSAMAWVIAHEVGKSQVTLLSEDDSTPEGTPPPPPDPFGEG